uniref:GDP-D-glucose phosphorylase 1 n=1 Tax=Glossina brevipalpis TaxID=37001 RepID=A0A1A9WTA9_9MUSC
MLPKDESKFYIDEIMKRWQKLQETSNTFAYRLKVQEWKYLDGPHCIYSELNPERTSLRRAPQSIHSLDPVFEENKFNFKKILQQEVMLIIPYDTIEISMIVNKSPLTQYHSLICPDVQNGLAQRVTLGSLRFCRDFLWSLDEDCGFRIGYNSPGALASVNHLHLHLINIEKDLYIDHVKLDSLCEGDIYRLNNSMPTQAVCWIFNGEDSTTQMENKTRKLHEFLEWLCRENIPHNIFMTPDRTKQPKRLKIFVYPRENFCVVKDFKAFNIGFCEMSGYVPVGDKELFDRLTETQVFQRIREETGLIFQKILNYFESEKT